MKLHACFLLALLATAGVAFPAAPRTASQTVQDQSPAPVPSLQGDDLQKPATTFKAGTELVALNVTVTDDQNHYMRGLTKEDFAVYEDGVRQEVTFFATNSVPLDLAILIDTSASMLEKLNLAQAAAVGFAKTLRPGDRGEVMTFSEDIRVLQPFTSDVHALEAAIRGTRAHGGTALYNAIYVALQEFVKLNKQASDIRRSAVVVLTDGEDTASLLSFDDVLDRAKRTGISIYPIRVISAWEMAKGQYDGSFRHFTQSDYALKMFAQETGARVFFPVQLFELNGVYQQIAEELSVQYSLGYPPTDTRCDGLFRRIVVQLLKHPAAHPRTRSGYYAPRAGIASRTPSR